MTFGADGLTLIGWLPQAGEDGKAALVGVSLSAWLPTAAILLIAIAGGSIRYGPPVIGWLKRRYFPEFWVQVLQPVQYSASTGEAIPAFRVKIPRGYYVLDWGVQIGSHSVHETDLPILNGRTEVRQLYPPRWILLPPNLVIQTGDRATVNVSIRRVHGLYLFRRSASAGSIAVSIDVRR